jgi:hypothetical protein
MGPGGKARPGGDTNHSPHLVPKSILTRSCTSSSPCLLHGGSEAALLFIFWLESGVCLSSLVLMFIIANYSPVTWLNSLNNQQYHNHKLRLIFLSVFFVDICSIQKCIFLNLSHKWRSDVDIAPCLLRYVDSHSNKILITVVLYVSYHCLKNWCHLHRTHVQYFR